MMKKISLILFMLTLAASSSAVSAQKKSKSGAKLPRFRVLKKATVQKPEIEDWKEFDSQDLKLKAIFPKTPTVTVNKNTLGRGSSIQSSIIQSYINSDYYMVEVREYPPNIIPARTDMGENYGQWLRTFILWKVNVLSEKSFDYNQYKMVEFVYQQIAGEVVIHRAMVVGDNLYQFIVQFEVKKPDTVEQTIEKNKGKLDKFFLSFEITGDEFVS